MFSKTEKEYKRMIGLKESRLTCQEDWLLSQGTWVSSKLLNHM